MLDAAFSILLGLTIGAVVFIVLLYPIMEIFLKPLILAWFDKVWEWSEAYNDWLRNRR